METPQEPTPESPAEPTGGAPESPQPPPAPAVPPPATPPPAAAAPSPAPPPSAWERPDDVVGPAPGYEFGGAGERLVAYLVDSLIIGVLVIGVGLVGLLVALVAWPLAFLIWTIGGLAVFIGYFPYFWTKTGQTPGLRMFQLHVVRDRDGGPVSAGSALLRLFGLYVIDGLVFYLGFIWIFVDKRKRCWHDLIAGTVVVKRTA